MMRAIIPILAAAILMPLAANGQAAAKVGVPNVPPPRDPLPRFTIAPRGGSLPPVGLPLPPHGLQPPNRPHVPGKYHRYYGGIPYWPGAFFYAPPLYVEPAPEPEPVPEPEPQPPGRLYLDILPGTAQIFVDGYYVGMALDFGLPRGGLIEAGIHRLDIVAPGHDAVAVDLRVTSGQSMTYRDTLRALPPPAAVPPSTFYLIPGCYMGNIPPKDASLPPTCDQRRATTWQP